MIHDWGLITVSYQDDLVFSQGQSFPSGSLLVQLLNCFQEYDTNREILGYIPRLSHLQYEMEHSRCQSMVFENARLAIISILEYLPMLPSFSALEIEDERTYINDLFSESTRLEILSYFENKTELARLRSIRREEIDDVRHYATYNDQEQQYEQVLKILEFYQFLDMDIRTADEKIREFVQKLPTLPRLDEKHMLPAAIEILGSRPFQIAVAYVPILKTSRSKNTTIARQVHFDNLMSFILTDFYEGLHHGYYPQLCPICGKFFLMTSARRQVYCDGMSPYEIRGKRLSCRKYAAAIGRKERAENDPVTDIYNRRCSAIRVEKGRKTITPEFAEAVIKLANEHKLKALQDESYAQQQYGQDMTREKLYADAEERLK